ncbi:MAG: DUF262 domain-containing protein [Firmicutes bacterium]|nr:DUF262 domain-containing protein [Bacillota bacterium]
MKFNYNDILEPKNIKKYNSVSSTNEDIKKYKVGEFRIVTEQARYPLANIKQIFSGSNYLLQPEYQRRRVWDTKRKSKLIESFMINVPVPPVFLYETEYSQYEVMDGLQRISTILDFFNNKFKLEDLEIWPELNGKTYNDLPLPIRESVDRRYLSATILLKETAPNKLDENMMKRFVFERLNTGGIELSPQEIRNALYTSNFNKLVIKLAEDVQFKSMLGSLDDDDYRRMEDCELVLRFFCYKSAIKHKLSKSTKYLLDTYSEIAQSFSNSELIELESLFKKTINYSNLMFGDFAFSRSSAKVKFEKMIFDTVTITISEMFEEGLIPSNFADKSIQISKTRDSCFINNEEVFNGKYTAISAVRQRVDLLKADLVEFLNE